MSETSWTWRMETSDGAEVTVDGQPGAGFPTQADAESWLGEEWRRLRDDGVDQVHLLCGTETVYGPMSLHEAG